MDRGRPPAESKTEKRLINSISSPAENKKRPIRRVQSPSGPRAWRSRSCRQKFGGHVYKSR
ncbi:hypothetical protein GOODEAATRI_007336, partial [Goodea atripinnis]